LGYANTVPPKKRVHRICEAISSETGRSTTVMDAKTTVRTLNRVLKGWASYFCLGPVCNAYRAVDSHTRRRLCQWRCAKYKGRGMGTGRFPDARLHDVLGRVRLITRIRSFP
jgi:hypothetical protein